ncbi:Zn(2)-C6 fungal-type domain-containing protein [Fusarium sp. Ph1]|nr:Zn(2)-C6 fungal-type domain-containing protein [Fusarium sp. Ph1]
MSKRSRGNSNHEVSEASFNAPKRVAIGAHNDQPVAHISRNIRACTTCRKHKIKCLMDDTGPPCRRCTDKKLSCVVSKNLQTIIDEKTELSEAVLADLESLHSAVKEMRSAAGMPDLPPLRISLLSEGRDSSTSQPPITNFQYSLDEVNGPSCDNSPKLTPEDDRLPHAPIHSLYALTKMRALRSPEDPKDGQSKPIDDFISRGLIQQADAERLFALYRDRLDGFIYSIGCRYKSLDELRRKSSILSAATLTVAALHDPDADKVYGICSSELRRLTEKSMLQRSGDRDYFRALSIASYWLSDLSWTLSGHAIRRATECNVHNSFSRAIKEQTEDAIDYARIRSILFICDQHLAILYDRPAIIQDEWSTQDWEGFLQAPFATAQDERLMSQVELMGVVRSVRQLFGPDKGETIPRVYVSQIGHYNRQLDQWIAKWTTRLPEQHPAIGGFPRKGALLHFHFAQLYLFSHVFRGQSDAIPGHFLDSASMAVTAASAIIDMLVTDPDISSGIVGMPSYLISMTAFCCMFLAKVAHKYGDNLIRRDQARDKITQLIEHLRSLSMGKWHLASLMIGGLEKVLTLLAPTNGVDDAILDVILNGDSNHGFGDAVGVEHMLPRVDGNPCPTWDTTFGLSPIFGFDPAYLDVDGYLQSIAMFPNGETQ